VAGTLGGCVPVRRVGVRSRLADGVTGTACGLRVTGCGLRVAGCGLRVAEHADGVDTRHAPKRRWQ